MGYIPRAKETEQPLQSKGTEVTPVAVKENVVPKQEDTKK